MTYGEQIEKMYQSKSRDFLRAVATYADDDLAGSLILTSGELSKKQHQNSYKTRKEANNFSDENETRPNIK